MCFIEYKCNSCNKSFYYNKDSVIEKCIFCNNSNLEKKEVQVNKSINKIAFKIDKDYAYNKYRKSIMFNPLIPFKFKKKSNINNIIKLYLLVNVSDVNINGNIISNCNDNNVNYSVTQNINFDYNDLVFFNSSLIDRKKFLDICDYNFNELEEFNDVGDFYYLLDDSGVDEKEIDKIKKYIEKTCLNNVNHSLKKIENDNTNILLNNTKKVLIPIYLLREEYNNKNYLYVMNGNTGTYYIDLVVGKLETIIFSILLFIIIFLFSFLLAYFL